MNDPRIERIKQQFQEFSENIVKAMASDSIGLMAPAISEICNHLQLDMIQSYYVAEHVSELCVKISQLQSDRVIELIDEIIKIAKEGLC